MAAQGLMFCLVKVATTFLVAVVALTTSSAAKAMTDSKVTVALTTSTAAKAASPLAVVVALMSCLVVLAMTV